MARRSIAFRASRSSNRPAQMRRTCDDTRSDMDRYSSISWTPAAKVSSVGASPLVMRERREATADGGIGGSGVAEVDDSGSGCVIPGCNDANSFCWEGSSRERSILFVSDVEDSGCNGAGCCASDPLDIGGFIRGTDGGRRSAFSECLSRCNLDSLVLAYSSIQPEITWTYFCICSSSSLILSAFCTFFGCGFLTTIAGGAVSSRANQLESSEFVEKSLSNSSWITRAGAS